MTNKESSKRHIKAVSVVYRQWMILKYLSNSSEGKTIGELHAYLTAEGGQSERTTQRDFLSGIFPLLYDRDGHDVRWYWERHRCTELIDGLSFFDSVSLLLVPCSLTSLLSKLLFKGLASQFALAASTLSNSTELGNWSQKFANVGPELSNEMPAISENVLERVQNAVLREQQLDVLYQAIHQSEPKAYRLAPLASSVTWSGALSASDCRRAY